MAHKAYSFTAGAIEKARFIAVTVINEVVSQNLT